VRRRNRRRVLLGWAQTKSEVLQEGWGPGALAAKPAIADLDGDGLLDLLAGDNDGPITHYEQEAAGAEHFVQIADAFCGIDVGSAAPHRASPTSTATGFLT
jgi:hypothetical protein